MSALCPICQRLVPIRAIRIDPNGRWVYKPHYHDNGDGQGCAGKELR